MITSFKRLALLYFRWWLRYTDTGVTLTISPMTWLSLFPVRLTPKMPKTTKTIAPVSTRGRTAGWPHAPPPHGLKPNVLDAFVLAAEEGSLKKRTRGKSLSRPFYIQCQNMRITLWCGKILQRCFRRCHFEKLVYFKEVLCCCIFSILQRVRMNDIKTKCVTHQGRPVA